MSLTALIDSLHARFSNGHVARPSRQGRIGTKALTHAWHIRGKRPDGSLWHASGFAISQAHAQTTLNHERKIHVGSAITFAEVAPVITE